jgi:AcrR family transcriptional regulator
MPKIVDHEARRVELGEAVLRVLARDGLDRLTFRTISKEAGYSVGAMQHYFTDRDELVNFANRLAFERTERRIETLVQESHPPLRALLLVLQEGLPLDRERIEECSAWLAFWSHAVTSSRLRDAQARRVRAWRQLVERLLADAQAAGEVHARVDVGLAAEILVAFVDGVGTQAMLEPKRLPASTLVGMLEATIEQVTT